MLHIPQTNLLLLAAKQEPYKKAYLLTKNVEKKFWKKFRKMDQQAEKDKTERVTGLGRRTREEIANWNQMTALRFQTGKGGETSDIPGLPSMVIPAVVSCLRQARWIGPGDVACVLVTIISSKINTHSLFIPDVMSCLVKHVG